ncbi:hypothetical protein Tco_1541233 [Tanacetum coccineum]
MFTTTTQTTYTPASNVHFECEEGIINFNNGIALLESKIPLYHPMLQLLSNSCISTALTKQPSVYYSKYLREFWYTTKVEKTNKITFTLSNFDKPLSFTLDDFSTIIGLKRSENFVPLPPKETVRAGLATLGLVDENDPSILSTNLVNSLLLKMKYFSLIWKPVTQSKATTDKKSRKKKSLASSKIKTLKIVKEFSPYPQVTDTQLAEELATTVDATQSIDASESVEEPGNQPELTDAEKVHKHIVEEEADKEGYESPYDTEFEIKVVKRINLQHIDDEDQIKFMGPVYADMEDDTSVKHQEKADSDLESMTEDELESLFGFEAEETDNANLNASADKPNESDPLGHLHIEISSLTANVKDLKSSLAQQIIKDSVKQALPKFDKRVKKTLKAQVPEIILKPPNNAFNLLNKKERSRFLSLQMTLGKTIKIKVGKSILCSVRKEVKVVSELLKYCVTQLDKNDVNLRELVDLIRDLVALIDTASAKAKAAPEGGEYPTKPETSTSSAKAKAPPEGENMSTQENKDEEITVDAPAQGEQQPTKPETADEALANAQGEQLF